MSRRIARAWRPALLLVLGLGAAACREPTEITIVVTTDLPCDRIGGTQITVGRLGEIESKPATSESLRCLDGKIGSLVVLPSGGKSDEIAARVVTGVGKTPQQCLDSGFAGCIVARRALHFIPHTPLVVRIPMRGSCTDLPCGPRETCVDGTCVGADLDATKCATPEGCDESSLPRSPDREKCTPRPALDASLTTAVEAPPALAWDPDAQKFWISWLNATGAGLFVIRNLDLAGKSDSRWLPSPPVGTAPGATANWGAAQLIVGYSRVMAGVGFSAKVGSSTYQQSMMLGYSLTTSASPESPTGPPSGKSEARPLVAESLALGDGRVFFAGRLRGTGATPTRVDAYKVPPLLRDRNVLTDAARAISIAWNATSRTLAVASVTTAGGTVRLFDDTLASKGTSAFAAPPAPPADVDLGVSIAPSEDGFVLAYVAEEGALRLRLVSVDATTGVRTGSIRLGEAPAFPRILGVDARGKITLAWLEQGDAPKVMLERFDAAMRPTSDAVCVTCDLGATVASDAFGLAGDVDVALGIAVHAVEATRHVQRLVPVDCLRP